MFLRYVLGFVLAGVWATKMPNLFGLILHRSIGVATLATDHLPPSLIVPVGDPKRICVLTPAKVKPPRVGEMIVLV
jgi:hypothetical protein